MGLGRVWYGAKYSHGVWERVVHILGKSFWFAKIERSEGYFLSEPISLFESLLIGLIGIIRIIGIIEIICIYIPPPHSHPWWLVGGVGYLSQGLSKLLP